MDWLIPAQWNARTADSIELEPVHWKWRDTGVPLLAEVDFIFLEPWWWNSGYIHLLTSSVWPAVRQCSQQLVLCYCETGPKRTLRQLHKRPFNQHSHSHALLPTELLNLASVPTSTTEFCCDFLSVQLGLCSSLLGNSSSSLLIRRSFGKIFWPCDYIIITNQSFVQAFSLHVARNLLIQRGKSSNLPKKWSEFRQLPSSAIFLGHEFDTFKKISVVSGFSAFVELRILRKTRKSGPISCKVILP